MASYDELIPARSAPLDADPLRAATAAYLARYRGTTRMHTESDLRIYLTWCTDRDVKPLTAKRYQVELYVRWLQEVRGFRPSTVSLRLSVVALPHLRHRRHPGAFTRRPRPPSERPTRITHPRALAPAVRSPAVGGSRIRQPQRLCLGRHARSPRAPDLRSHRSRHPDLGEERGHRVLRVVGKGNRVVLVPLPPAVGRALERAIGDWMSGPILLNTRGVRMAGLPHSRQRVLQCPDTVLRPGR